MTRPVTAVITGTVTVTVLRQHRYTLAGVTAVLGMAAWACLAEGAWLLAAAAVAVLSMLAFTVAWMRGWSRRHGEQFAAVCAADRAAIPPHGPRVAFTALTINHFHGGTHVHASPADVARAVTSSQPAPPAITAGDGGDDDDRC